MVDALDTLEFSKNQVDRLGDRLRRGDISENDLRLLDTYRRSFTQAYEDVVGRIASELGLEPTGRPAKSTTSIIDKLQRETVRLSQMQDIAGCRIVVPLLAAQDEVIHRLKILFDRVDFDDRRKNPSHGYRAVHVIVNQSGKLVEVQVRTALQHSWAELSEKLSDEFDSSIKYGGGSKEIASYLSMLSDVILDMEMALRAKDGNQILIETQRLFESVGQFGDVVKRERAKK
jgi:ppGpp synthetase/RelA/SpoT-type nucleotidyltranferase